MVNVWHAGPVGLYAQAVDFTHLLLFLAVPVLFIGLQWLFSAWYGGYRSVIDFYYHEIQKSPKAGRWYYGSAREAASRGGSLKWNVERRIRRD